MLLADLASAIGGQLVGARSGSPGSRAPDAVDILRVAPVESAGPGDVTMAIRGPELRQALESGCSAVIVPESLLPDATVAPAQPAVWLIASRNARLSFARAIEALHPKPARSAGVHERACVSPAAALGRDVWVGPFAVVGDRCVLGDRVEVGAGAVLEEGVTVGDDTRIGPNVTVGYDTAIGRRCIIHAGVVIGGDGFGFVETPDGAQHKVPQVGRVVLEDDVEIGANSCVDRATLAATVIGRGTKIDNLVQIAHNVRVGRDVVIAGCSGVAGSTVIGDRVKIAGGVGIVDHVVLGDACTIGAASQVMTNVPPGAVFSGTPARNHAETLRIQAATRKLPGLVQALTRGHKRSNNDRTNTGGT